MVIISSVFQMCLQVVLFPYQNSAVSSVARDRVPEGGRCPRWPRQTDLLAFLVFLQDDCEKLANFLESAFHKYRSPPL